MATMSTKPFLPSPASQTTTQDTSTDLPLPGGGNSNYIYIYSFLSTLFGLLCIALLVLLRALVRRRRLDAQFAAFDHDPTPEEAAAAEQQQQRRRRKKRKDYGEKPGFIDAWIGNGPVPTSLSTEALLEVIQPFSVTRAAVSTEASGISEKTLVAQLVTESSSVEHDSQLQQQKQRQFLGLPPAPASASSCSHSDEKLSLRAASPPPPLTPSFPTTPQLYELEQIQVGFLIAMPRPPPLPSLSLKKAASCSTLNVATKDIDGESFWSLAESKWSDHLPEGQLPELMVGVSTLCVPIERGGSWHD